VSIETTERETLLAALRYEADTSEKAIDFMDDDEVIADTRVNVMLLRQAADEIDRLVARLGRVPS
jgi:hypothetical protein